MATKHDKTANRIAKKEGLDYNRGPGPDIIGARRIIEVETEKSVPEGLRQLRGFKKPVYIAGADAAAVKKALETTKGTTVGVMSPTGKVLKKSTRKKR